MSTANAASRREAATARPTAATTGDEDGTEEDNRRPATTAPATPNGPTDLKKLSHTFFVERASSGR